VLQRIVEYRVPEQRLQELYPEARWQSGYAAACKAVYAGSIPTLASILTSKNVQNLSETLTNKGFCGFHGRY
jgi:hypothetical protein